MSVRHSPQPRLVLALLAAPLAGGCMLDRPQPGIMISTRPAGAQVVVDGQDSGFVTPARLALTRRDWHRVEVKLSGYEPASRLFAPGLRRYAIGWDKGYTRETNLLFPFFLPWEDMLIPFRFDDSLSPGRVHIALQLDEPEPELEPEEGTEDGGAREAAPDGATL